MIKAIVFAALFTTAVGTQAVAQSAESGIQKVISDQITAFLADDFATAFTFASPNIKRMFGTPDNFGRMVRQGYPMVHRPSEVEFAGLAERNGRMVQTVILTDGSGTLHFLDYEMVETDAGWQINGVWLRRPPSLGA
ncbi:MAG: DUF4864 domain-containing protein [Pseudomonadota bacterium]